MRKVIETSTIDGALEFAKQDVYDLQNEMSDAADAMPEQLSAAHAEAAQLLDVATSFLSSCDTPSYLGDTKVTWAEWRGKIYRPQRRENVVNFLRAYLAHVPETDETEKLRDDLDGAITVLERVFFPGMRGRRAA